MPATDAAVASPSPLVLSDSKPALPQQQQRPDAIHAPTPTPTPTPTVTATAAARHSKKLSLNFPILVPTGSTAALDSSLSATTNTALSPIGSPRLSPVRGPAGAAAAPQKSNAGAVESTDFLTLLATQERKVLELREELQRAEGELDRLKRQWASYEAGRKKSEARQQGGRLRKGSVGAAGGRNGAVGGVDVAAGTELKEKTAATLGLERRRTMVERTNGHAGAARRSGQRVFSGSRHARTLSLLATSTTPAAAQKKTSAAALSRASLDETASLRHQRKERENVVSVEAGGGDDTFDPLAKLGLSRTSTLPELTGFGRTYKELAGAGRRSLGPVPPSAEVLVRQGQRVAEGLREGLWNFFEDIRQATVGEEGISGPQSGKARGISPGDRKMVGARKGAINGTGETGGKKETSFWREFGVETPRKRDDEKKMKKTTKSTTTETAKRESTDAAKARMKDTDADADAVSVLKPADVSSTETTEVPDLLGDVEDDEWEAWESPTIPPDHQHDDIDSLEAHAESNKTSPKPKQGEKMPWPEIRRSTPSKLGRTVSGLLGEWDREGGGGDGHGKVVEEEIVHDGYTRGAVDEFHSLASPHM